MANSGERERVTAKRDKLNPSLGALTGRSNYEPNPGMTQAVLWGSGERPGMMAEAVNGWPQLRSRVGAFCDVAAMVSRTHKPYADETPEEARWNDAFEAMLESRVVIRTGLSGVGSNGSSMCDGDRIGSAALMRWGALAAIYGFQPFYAHWSDGYGLASDSDRLILTPLLQGACHSVTREIVKFQSNRGLVPLKRERVIWIAPDAPYGFARGPALVRPLVQPWAAYQEQVIAEDIDTAMRAGLAVIYDGGAGPDARSEWNSIGEAIADGERYVVIGGKKDDGASIDIRYPSGTAPDFESKAKRLRAAVDDIFGTEVLSIASNGNGSRAAAETMAGITAKIGMASVDSLLDLCFGAVARWVAFHDGYSGRIRRVGVAEIDNSNPREAVDTLAAAYTAGLVDIGPNRREFVAAELLRLPDEDAAQEVQVVPLSVNAPLADSFQPPDSVRANARRGLELRKEHGRGGTAIGVARARDLINGNVSLDTVGRMRSFFARHSGNDRSDETSAANIAWLLWGGDSGRRWVESQAFDSEFSLPAADRTAYLIAGPPGAGKSTRASVIARDSDGPVTTIDADRYLYDSNGHFDWSPSKSKAAHDAVSRDIEAAIARGDSTVTVVAPFTTSSARSAAMRPLVDAGYSVTAIQMMPDVGSLVSRNNERPDGRGVAESVTRAIAKRFEPIAAHEFDHVEIDGGDWRMSHADGGSCCSGHMMAAPKHEVIGSDGRSVPMYRDPLELTIRGVTVRPESHYPWATGRDDRAERLADFEQVLADWLPGARQRLAGAAGDLADFDRVKRELTQSAFDIIGEHLDRARSDSRKAREMESASQSGSPIVAPADVDPAMWRGMEAATRERIDFAARQAASNIVAKVANEIGTHVGLTGGIAGFVPVKKVSSYAREIEPLDSGVSNGEFDAGAAPAGMVVTAAVRVSTKKRNRVCDPCWDEDGRTFLFPEDRAAFAAYRGVPDPLCTGGTAFCECSWVLVYGTPEGD